MLWCQNTQNIKAMTSTNQLVALNYIFPHLFVATLALSCQERHVSPLHIEFFFFFLNHLNSELSTRGRLVPCAAVLEGTGEVNWLESDHKDVKLSSMLSSGHCCCIAQLTLLQQVKKYDVGSACNCSGVKWLYIISVDLCELLFSC